MNTLFNEEWFIQTLVEYILQRYNYEIRRHWIIQIRSKELVCNIFLINKTCYNFGQKHSHYSIIARDNSNMGIYKKERTVKTLDELKKIIPRFVMNNDMINSYNYWETVFSAYRVYTFRNKSVEYIKTYFSVKKSDYFDYPDDSSENSSDD